MSHGCYNRPPLLDFNIVPARWPGDEPLHIPNRMTRECQYTKDDQYNDQQCVGCSHHITKAGGAHHEKV